MLKQTDIYQNVNFLIDRYKLIDQALECAKKYIIGTRQDAGEDYKNWLDIAEVKNGNLEDVVKFHLVGRGYSIDSYVDSHENEVLIIRLDVVHNEKFIFRYVCSFDMYGNYVDDYADW